ncbi:hypothetical protein ACTJKT_13005 [Pseudomonas sp. 22526]|uniref:hypothetical protein n=1 Tax=Pseudomonas sp. 22526 TaxID=3453937 RepID=UPI003F85A4FC
MKKALIACAATFLLAGCEHLDSAMSTTSSVLDQTGDILSGDLRGLGESKHATLTQIWNDWQQNEVTAKDKWDRQTLVIPGIVTRITKTDDVIYQNQIAVIFSDPTNPKCKGQGLTRDDLMVNEKKISNLKKGDRINVTGVLGTSASKWADGEECWFSFDKAQITLANK